VPEKLIVFIVGGATYEEAKELSSVYNVPGNSNKVILGGTNIVNSNDFLAEVAKLKGGKFGQKFNLPAGT
jgi:hypothetical protein